MNRRLIITGLDNVLCDANWRKEYIDQTGWDSYHEACAMDPPCEDTAHLVIEMLTAYDDYEHIIVTNRNEKYRRLTMTWLSVFCDTAETVLMRPDNDFSKVPACMVNLLKEKYGENFHEEVLFAIDENDDVLAAYRALGITTLQIHHRRMK